jgi:hypothetical protein
MGVWLVKVCVGWSKSVSAGQSLRRLIKVNFTQPKVNPNIDLTQKEPIVARLQATRHARKY